MKLRREERKYGKHRKTFEPDSAAATATAAAAAIKLGTVEWS